MGGSSGGVDVKDSEDQKALANIAKEKWRLYQREFVPIEDRWIEQINGSDGGWNNQRYYDQAAGIGNVSAKNNFGLALNQAMGRGGNMARLGAVIGQQAIGQAATETDLISRMENSQQDRYIQGLGAISAMGAGREQQAINTMHNAASMSMERARNDAVNSFNRGAANREMIGMGIGAAGRYGLGYMQNEDL